VLAGCRPEQRAEPAASPGADALLRASASPPACTLYPEQMEGPFFLDLDLLRSDIVDGRPGAPLALRLQILDAGRGCNPVANAMVDVWHCDAAGVYSGYARQPGGVDARGERFLRGSQVTDSGGRVAFRTIYPGWYPGRTTHVHFTVHLASRREATSQLYFPEDATAAVYAAPPYAARGQKDTSNARDALLRRAPAPLASVAREPSGGHAATLVVGVAT
jgi:protocatechuate 3,4-dioxygenase beta subunit